MDEAGKGVPEDQLGAGLRAAFGGAAGAEHSVLARLERSGRSVPRVLLRDVDEDASPLLKPRGGREGRYQVVGEIARGGVGVVLKGRDIDLGRDVAMKVLRDEHDDNREIIQRFVEEAQIGGQLQHPGIVPVYEMGLNEKRRPYFTMKLVKGKTLAAMLRARRSPSENVRRFLAIFERVCDTMAYAHSRGVVHRDLKPANIIVGAYSEVQIVDWGFAKVLGRTEPAHVDQTIIETVRSGSESMAGSVLGTPAYMPPEQALGQVESLDKSSDVFGLGAILCEILTGKPPYVGEKQHEIMMLAARREFDESRLDGHDLGPLALRCLAATQSARPQDAGELAQQVQDHLNAAEERTKSAQVRAAEEQARAVEARHARQLTLGIAVALLLAIGAGALFWMHGEKRAREGAERIARQTRPLLERANLARGQGDWAEALAAARHADQLARAGGADEETRERSRAILIAIEAEKEQADAEGEQARRDAELLQQIEAARLTYGDRFDAARVETMYREAVEQYAGSLRGLVRTAHARPVAFRVEVAFCLLDRARLLRRRTGAHRSEWGTFVEAAQALDDDPWRRSLRDAVAREDLRRVVEIALTAPADDAKSLYHAGSLVIEFGRSADALPLLMRAWRLAPNDFWINYRLAGAFRGSDPNGSIPFARALVALRPESTELRLRLASRLEAAGRTREALDILERYRDKRAQSATHWARIGDLRYRLGDEEGAMEAFRRVKQLPLEGQPRALNGLAWILVRDPRMPFHDPQLGLRASLRGIGSHHCSACLNTLAVARYRTGDFTGAIETAQESLNLKIEGPVVAYNEYLVAMAWARLGSTDKARAAFGRAERALGTTIEPELKVFRDEAMELLGIEK